MTDALPPIDRDAARRMWADYRAATGVPDEGCPAECFGDSPALADELLAEVLAGRKRATSSLLEEYREEGEALPVLGGYSLMCDGRGLPAVVLRTVELRLGRFYDVDEAFARDEGEGDLSLEYWRTEHERFWTRVRAAAGVDWSPRDTHEPGREIVQERFAVVWPPEYAD